MKHLIDDYYLSTDSYNYILVKRSIKKGGKNEGSEIFTNVAYFGFNLKHLYEKLIDIYTHKHILNKDYESLLNKIKEIIDLKKEV